MENKTTLRERVENRSNTAKAIKNKMGELLATVTAQVAGMMINAGVCAVRFTDKYDRVHIALEDDEMATMDGLFLHNGNLYCFTYKKSEEEEGMESDRFARLFGYGDKDCLTEDGREEADLFVEDTDNPLYNLLDDTYSPFESLSEILDALPVILTENGF